MGSKWYKALLALVLAVGMVFAMGVVVLAEESAPPSGADPSVVSDPAASAPSTDGAQSDPAGGGSAVQSDPAGSTGSDGAASLPDADSSDVEADPSDVSGSELEEDEEASPAMMAFAAMSYDLATGPLVIPDGSSDSYTIIGTYAPDPANPGAPMITVGSGFTGSLLLDGVTATGGDYVGVQVGSGFSGALHLKNVSFDSDQDGVHFSDGTAGTLILENANIDTSTSYYGAAVVVMGGGNNQAPTSHLNVVLADGSTTNLRSGEDRAGLEVGEGAQITISGGGTLNAISEDSTGYGAGAGIGAGYKSNSSTYLKGGNITILSGNINAVASYHGAGIGGSGIGSTPKYNGNIVIVGGNVTSHGGDHGAGIGGGCSNRYGTDGGAILVLPPANIAATVAGSQPLVGVMDTTIYIGDPSAYEVQVKTSEDTVSAPIFMDVTNVDGVVALLTSAGVLPQIDPARIPVGTTDGSGVAITHMMVQQPVRFYTEVLGSNGLAFQNNSVVVDQSMTVILQPTIWSDAASSTPSSSSQAAPTPSPSPTPAPAVTEPAPQTGDASFLGLWGLAAATGGAGLCGVTVMRRRKK